MFSKVCHFASLSGTRCDPTLLFIHESRTFVVQHRGVEQLVARWAHNPKATGSSPVPATTDPRLNSQGFFIFINYASAV
jgi:hypothetical protein